MRARGHLTGGVIAGCLAATCASAAGWVPGIAHPVWWGVALTALFFSLFPDVDTDSLPRRWFYRGILLVLLYLGWFGWWQLGTMVAGLALLPLVDHHRGWTHGRYVPLLLPAVLCAGLVWWEGWPATDGPALTDTLQALSRILTPVRLSYIGAAVAGWYTHLLLDGLFRIFPQDPS